MDPFEKYEPWIDPDKKLIGLDKIHNIVEDYKNKHNNKNKKETKKQIELLLMDNVKTSYSDKISKIKRSTSIVNMV